MMTKSKAFYKLLIEHSLNPKKVKKLISQDQRLNHDERKILQCFLLMRENKNHEALQIVEDIKKQSDPLVESMRLFLLGCLLNVSGLQTKSIEFLNASYNILPKDQDSHFEFIILVNLYIIHTNHRNLSKAAEVIKTMDKLQGLNQKDILTLKKCQFNYYTISENFAKAKELYQELEKESIHFAPHTLISYYFDVWDFGVISSDFSLCEKILAKILEQRIYSLTQNYNYMKILLRHLMYDESVTINLEIFKSHPKLLNELKVIRSLELNRVEEAIQLWQGLITSAPHAYKENFLYIGFPTIFSRCLKKHESKFLNIKTRNIHYNKNLSLTDNIKSILEENLSLTKDELFKVLFNRDAEFKDDYARLSREIYKCKMMYNLQIETKKRLVTLVKKAA